MSSLRFFKNLDLKDSYISSRNDLDYISERNLVFMVCAYCNYISIEEISLFFDISPKVTSDYISYWIKLKYLKKIKLVGRVSCTDSLYAYTKQGYEYAKNLLGNHTFNYKLHKENPKNVHDYAAGMNFFPTLTLPFNHLITWDVETIYGSYRRDERTLCVDCELHYKERVFHIEEDLDNESNYVLLNKLNNYYKYELFSTGANNHYLIISFFKPFYYNAPAFNQTQLQHIYTAMTSSGIDSLIAYKDSCTDSKQVSCIDSLLQLAGNLYAATDISLEDIKRMATKQTSSNLFYQQYCEMEQYRLFTQKKRSLETYLSTNSSNYPMNVIYSGTPLYVVPTMMFRRYVKGICAFQETMMESIKKCLSMFYSFNDSYSERALAGFDKYNNPLVLRNCLSAKEGNVFIEFASIDISSAFRIERFFSESDSLRNDKPSHLIILVDNEADARYLALRIGDNAKLSYLSAGIMSDTSHNDMYFMLYGDLFRERKSGLFREWGYTAIENKQGQLVKIRDSERFNIVSKSNADRAFKKGL